MDVVESAWRMVLDTLAVMTDEELRQLADAVEVEIVNRMARDAGVSETQSD